MMQKGSDPLTCASIAPVIYWEKLELKFWKIVEMHLKGPEGVWLS